MHDRYSRRSFLTGVLACGTLSASAAYFLPGGRGATPAPRNIELKLVTGADSTGARHRLIEKWNHENPSKIVKEHPAVIGGTGDERATMLSRAREREADILVLDVIHIPEFAARGLITPVLLKGSDEFLEPTLRAGQARDEPGLFWAVPFNTDVGMLFTRNADDDQEIPTLAQVLSDRVEDGSHEFVGQLSSISATASEAFVVNVLEHALSVDDHILDDDGHPAYSLHAWQNALEQLRRAISRGRVTVGADEDDSRELFKKRRLRYMRNWPVKYRELQAAQDPDPDIEHIRVDRLPIGILGGSSLAVVASSPHPQQAFEFIQFATDLPQQKDLAVGGLAPVRRATYTDPELASKIPYLGDLRNAVATARPRAVNPNYLSFSKVIHDRIGALLRPGSRDLPGAFVDEMRAALSSTTI